MILALLFAARAVVMEPTPCGSMSPSNIFITYVANDGSCTSFDENPCNSGAVVQFYPGYYGYNLGCGNHRFTWEFSDGSSSNVPYPVHIFAGAGSHPVYLTIESGSQTLRVVRNIVVRAGVPEVGFSYTTDVNVVHFKIAPASGITSWTLEFGDGTRTVLQGTNPPEVTHRYEKAGAYSVSLGGGGMTSERIVVITIPRSRAVRH